MTKSTRSIFLKWEKLRLPYNLILVAFVFLLAPVLIRPTLTGMITLIGGCVGANILFLAGPAVEAYTCWIGFRQRFITPILFVAGVLVSFPCILFIGIQTAWMLN